MSIFSGIWIPLVTPFDQGAVDHRGLAALVARYRDAGVAGVVALGTTGEPSALTDEEQDAVIATVLEAAGALPVAVGVAGNQTAALHERVRQLNALPLAALMVPAPYYIRPAQAGILAHFTGIADLSAHPVLIYNIPYRTGVRIELETLLALAAHPRIVGIKDCGGSPDETLALILDGRLAVLTGDDSAIFTSLCMGASGAIAAAAHVYPEQFVAMHRALEAGRLAEGRAIHHALAPLLRALTAEPNPAPVKAALAALGRISPELRAPMTAATPELAARLAALLAA